MRTLQLLITFAAVILLPSNTLIGQQDCIDPLVLCGESPFQIEPVEGNGQPEALGLGSCFFEEFNTVWIELNIMGDGETVFEITPAGDSIDLDFVVYKLVDDCDSKIRVRCMISGEGGAGGDSGTSAECLGSTGLAFGENDVTETGGCQVGDNNFLAPLDVIAGEKYMILISDFSQSGLAYDISFGGTADLGCIVSSNQEFDFNTPDITVYPSMSNGLFTLDKGLDKDISMYVYHATGQLILTKDICGKQMEIIDLTNQSSGIYILVVEYGNKVFHQKLIVSK